MRNSSSCLGLSFCAALRHQAVVFFFKQDPRLCRVQNTRHFGTKSLAYIQDVPCLEWPIPRCAFIWKKKKSECMLPQSSPALLKQGLYFRAKKAAKRHLTDWFLISGQKHPLPLCSSFGGSEEAEFTQRSTIRSSGAGGIVRDLTMGQLRQLTG